MQNQMLCFGITAPGVFRNGSQITKQLQRLEFRSLAGIFLPSTGDLTPKKNKKTQNVEGVWVFARMDIGSKCNIFLKVWQ